MAGTCVGSEQGDPDLDHAGTPVALVEADLVLSKREVADERAGGFSYRTPTSVVVDGMAARSGSMTT